MTYEEAIKQTIVLADQSSKKFEDKVIEVAKTTAFPNGVEVTALTYGTLCNELAAHLCVMGRPPQDRVAAFRALADLANFFADQAAEDAKEILSLMDQVRQEAE